MFLVWGEEIENDKYFPNLTLEKRFHYICLENIFKG